MLYIFIKVTSWRVIRVYCGPGLFEKNSLNRELKLCALASNPGLVHFEGQKNHISWQTRDQGVAAIDPSPSNLMQ